MNFKILKSANSQYYWVLSSSNGQTLATSEMYVSKQGAKDTIATIKTIGVSSSTPVYDLA